VSTELTGLAVLCIVFFGVKRGLVSPFLCLLVCAALLATMELVPRETTEFLVLLVGMALWVESGSILSLSRDEVCSVGARSLATGAVAGLLAGLALWYGGLGPAPMPLVGAFGGAFSVALVGGVDARSSARAAVLLVERGPYGLAVKMSFCVLLLLSLVK